VNRRRFFADPIGVSCWTVLSTSSGVEISFEGVVDLAGDEAFEAS